MAAKDNSDVNKSDSDSSEEKSSGGKMTLVIPIAALLVFAGAGFGVGKFLKSSKAAPQESAEQASSETKDDMLLDDPKAMEEDGWCYELDPVVANLDVPGVQRYVRVGLSLVMSPELDQSKTEPFMNNKAPFLKHWLTIYLAGLSLEDCRGEQKLERIEQQIRMAYNQQLFPDQKPRITRILFKEFNVQ